MKSVYVTARRHFRNAFSIGLLIGVLLQDLMLLVFSLSFLSPWR